MILCPPPAQRHLYAQTPPKKSPEKTSPATTVTPQGVSAKPVDDNDRSAIGEIEEADPQLIYVFDPETGKWVLAFAGWTIDEVDEWKRGKQPLARLDKTPAGEESYDGSHVPSPAGKGMV